MIKQFFRVSLLIIIGHLSSIHAQDAKNAKPVPPVPTGKPAAKIKAAPQSVKRAPGVEEERVTSAVVRLFQEGHFSAPKLTDERSRQLFDEYFEALDPNKIYFLAEDVAEFSPYRLVLDDMLRKGALDFPFLVYERFLKRVKERIEYVKERVQKPFDFTKKESVILDREQKPWAADSDELDEIWRKRIKNQLLIEQFIREAASKDEGDKNANKWLSKRKPEEDVLRRFENYFRLLNSNDTYDVMENFLTVFTMIFDPHSSYMNWRTLEDFDIDMRLSLQGVGAVLTSQEGYTQVVRVIPGGPVDRDKRLKPGDRIIAVGQGNEESVDVVHTPLHKVVRLIRGKKGSTVRLTVLHSLNSVPTEIAIVRDNVKLEDSAAHGEVKHYKGPDGKDVSIGYIYLPSFYADWEAMRRRDPNPKSATTDVKRLIDKMMASDNIKGLIMDLRGNGGGSLEESITLAGLFIPSGPIVQVKLARARTRVHEDEDGGFAYTMPLVVMTDRTSASASEIFAGAIQDYKRGVIVGDQTTHGKGTVQTILRLEKYESLRKFKPGALKYTMAKFYRVTGHSTQKRGITPDVIFPSFFDHMDVGEANLKHVLPWDEIAPQKIDTTQVNISSYLPRIKSLSAARVAKNEKLQTIFEDIKRYGKRRQIKTLSLNKKERMALRKEDEYWAKRTNEIIFRDRPGTAEDSEKKKAIDLYLQEAMGITTDLINLSTADDTVK